MTRSSTFISTLAIVIPLFLSAGAPAAVPSRNGSPRVQNNRPLPAGSPIAKGVRVLERFDYRGVTLDDGALRRQFDEVRDFYLCIPNDDLLHGYRVRAGRPAPGVELGG